ncbi:unnamed protein product, partial [Arabidopsis halleri]
MRTRRRTYTAAATPPSLVTVKKPIVQALAAVSGTKRGRKLQSCTAKAAKGNRGGSKKKNKWLHFPPKPTFSKDGWVLARKSGPFYASTLLLNPFTRDSFYLPPRRHEHRSRFLAFSAAPTSPSCMVISYIQLRSCGSVVIDTWRPGETEWTTHCFENQLPFRYWPKCVFSNGMFYCLSECGYLGVFDPSKATWNILPVKPCPAFDQYDYSHSPVFMTEHEGDIFVIYTHCYNNIPTVFKLNSKHKEWQEKTDLGGLTIYTSWPASFVRAGLSTEH